VRQNPVIRVNGRIGLFGQLRLSVLSAGHVPDTLVGSCKSNPGVSCRLVWDVTHNSTAAALTSEFLNGPVQLLLRVLFVVLLALAIQWLAHRTINRLTEHAAQSVLPQLRNGVAGALRAPGRATTTGRRLVPRPRVRRRRSASDDPVATEAAAVRAADAAGAEQGVIDGEAALVEAGFVDERRKQRVRALGAILRSGASVTIFAVAGFIILGDLGINLAPLLASAGVVGVAIGFGAQNMVRDYLSGIFMLVEDQYGVGDVVTVGSATGTVENVTLRITRLRDVNGIVWHIRNGTIETLGNESQGWARAVIDFPVPFAADLATIRRVLEDTGTAMWNEPTWRAVMLEAPEVWGAQELSSTEVVMRLVVKTAPLRQWEVEREMRVRLKAALDAAGIFPAPAAD
jgi:small-conductance mechanosensitive channel